MKTNFISVQGSYKSLEISLFLDSKLCCCIQKDDIKASSLFFSLVDQILKENLTSLSDISFIAADIGPGSFTALRVIISSLNSISFSSNISLIGVDGLDALATECLEKHDLQQDVLIIPILNAFNGDIFFGGYQINSNNEISCKVEKGYKNIEQFLLFLKESFPQNKFLFCGNGVEIFKEQISNVLENKAILQQQNIDVASSKVIGEIALKRWINKEGISTQLLPLYLKIQNYKPKYM
ncbi:TPA: tRNA (adenosine(37)-N6)-threonylcarbamoyltransferase complex dimerization subunit type 1 TsaB [Candidatus Dependentiae bacterium]|nr:MAG: Universal bacterial protein YeaZ [candidate division TM6 bacterium GW2011_GWE2_31_21]KKP53226.1 MAG: Universal bacterial protein YeaZ [candidate division TM6 bacterium GW2011_GWF2_33_332]HBS48076.1 tRNA (adenosine(37)-N6)-threonylcarbamoyltransferase complex dimerization subunit type 1 TsaB [Candidatus Dependentiae bacterium]HBZ73321.1 tRNA (adenosine(37)-N6)-threonylcarbamoyltransferase complex dimerization subunit type 1 TsaB [Candidatus Dependentiae bacterium]